MLLDKVTCLTSALFLFLSLSICRSSSSSSSSLLLLLFFSNCFLEQGGGGGVERGTVGGRNSALYILIFFSAKNDSPTRLRINRTQAFQWGEKE